MEGVNAGGRLGRFSVASDVDGTTEDASREGSSSLPVLASGVVLGLGSEGPLSFWGEMEYECDAEWRERNQRTIPRWTPRSPGRWWENQYCITGTLTYMTSDSPTGRMSGRRRENIANMSTKYVRRR